MASFACGLSSLSVSGSLVVLLPSAGLSLFRAPKAADRFSINVTIILEIL